MTGADPFSFSRETSEGAVRIFLKGALDERTNLREVFSDLKGPLVTVDLREVTRINSSGVRSWINTMKQVAGAFSIEYAECSRAVVDQLNMITNFFTSGTIVSFYAPYYCRACDREKDMLLQAGPLAAAPGGAPEAPRLSCPECGGELVFHEDEEKYFSFLCE